MKIVPVQPVDANKISKLAIRSKAHWGYSAQFMEDVKEELTYHNDDISSNPTFMAQEQTQLVGFYQLVKIDEECIELEALFVDPTTIRKGVGKKLFEHAVKQARQLGFQSMSIQSDPYAESFYLKQGCIKVGEKPSLSIPGRFLPLMAYNLMSC